MASLGEAEKCLEDMAGRFVELGFDGIKVSLSSTGSSKQDL